jgi:hypothetical protein
MKTPQERYESIKEDYENLFCERYSDLGHTVNTWFEKGYVFLKPSYENVAVRPTKIRVSLFENWFYKLQTK